MKASPAEKDWNKCKDFFRYTAGRFLFDEADQLSLRSAKFDMNELALKASQSIGSALCVKIEKLPETHYSKTFLLTMDDDMQVIAKVPNLNAGPAYYTTASEVATMDFVRTVMKIPAPKVLAWSSRATENSVGAEYIIMEKLAGVPLNQKWSAMEQLEKGHLINSVINIEKTFASLAFSMFGSLYYVGDLNPGECISRSISYVDEAGKEVFDTRFAIGPTTDRKAFDDRRYKVRFDRGPWNTAKEYIKAIAHREVACIQKLEKLPRPMEIVNAPGCYHPTPEAKLLILRDYLAVAEYLLPTQADTASSTLWHHDLHSGNIFVNPERPREIVGIKDWESIELRPLFLNVKHDCPVLSVSLEQLDVPGFEAMRYQYTRNLEYDDSLCTVYVWATKFSNNRVRRALKQQEGLPCQAICGIVNMLQDGGQPLARACLMHLEREWLKVPHIKELGGPPCPLKYSADDWAALKVERAQFMNGVSLYTEILLSLGDMGIEWQGWVKPEDHDILKAKLRLVRQQFVNKMARNKNDRAQWNAAWPF